MAAMATLGLLVMFVGSAAAQRQRVLPIGPKGGGTCRTARDCQLAGLCTGSKCVCDPGWTGPLCHQLDLAPLPTGFTGGVWNSELSPRSSWGAAPHQAEDGKYHGWFNQLPDKCGLSSWLPGSYIEHGVADSPLGPFHLVNNTHPPDGKRDPLSGRNRFATNPHITYIKAEKRYLLYFNGRAWPANDLTNCWPSDNKTDTDGSHFHGGGACKSNSDCAGAFAGTDAHQGGAANICGKDGKCSCEHHSMGPHCNMITETVNVASSLSPNGPWTQLRPDGAAFWSDSEVPGGNAATRANLSNPDGGKYLSNPSAFALDNGTVVLAYSRAPGGPGGTGISIAPNWRGPYTRLTLPYPGPQSRSPFKSGKNYSIVGCGEVRQTSTKQFKSRIRRRVAFFKVAMYCRT